MNTTLTNSPLSRARAAEILNALSSSHILVIGDIILDRYIWGSVKRISPEAPVPIVHINKETSVPGGAANVARNLAELRVPVTLAGAVGRDEMGACVKRLLEQNKVQTNILQEILDYPTSTKTRILASRQQLLRLDAEAPLSLDPLTLEQAKANILRVLPQVRAVIVADYNKGLINQEFLDFIKAQCSQHKIWLSMDPKPSHLLDLSGVNLITPNRKEAFELAQIPDSASPAQPPLQDTKLLQVAQILLRNCAPANILITLGEHGMLLCRQDQPPIHIPTFAREVFDVSGAGDTVIAALTAAITTGASLQEAAILANHAAGVVVAKVGTATASPEEILETLPQE